MPERDYYEVLGVPPNATDEQIRRRFRELARQYHPDVNRSPDAEQRFKEITEAYRVLSSPSLRADYDLMRRSAQQARTGTGGATTTPPPRSRPYTHQGTHHHRTTSSSSTYTSARRAEIEAQQLLQSAMLAYARGNLREAASLAKQVLRLQRHNAQAYEILGDVYRQERRIEEAIAMFTCALQCNPRSASAQSKLDALLRQRYFAGEHPAPASVHHLWTRYGQMVGWTGVGMLVLAPWYLGLEADGMFQGMGFVSQWSAALVLLMLTAGMLSGALMALCGSVEPMAQVVWWPLRQGMPQARLAVAGLLGILGLFAFYAAAFLYLLIASTQGAFHRTLNRAVGVVVGLTLGFLLSYAPGREQVALFAPNLLWFGVLCGWAFGDAVRAQQAGR
ncbi:MAG: DnaJ domain-containing protein [Armatimonadota bacterium]|nr:DnaJ domain-containing protein [Armatimonadota bacterium]